MIQIGAPAATLDFPVEHLLACHRRIEQRLDTLVEAASHLETDTDAALTAIRNSLHFLDTNGILHTEDEERSLFPRLRERSQERLSTEEQEQLIALEAQHTEAEVISAELHSLAAQLESGGPALRSLVAPWLDCAQRLRTLYRSHIQAEDQLYPQLAERLLDSAALAAISSEMRQRREHR